MTKAIETIIAYHREWLGKHGPAVLEDSLGYLREDIDDGSPQAFQGMPASLGGLATYFGIRGAIDVIDGNSEGWQHISTACDFHAWDLKLSAESLFRQPRLAVGGWPLKLTNYTTIAACLASVSEKWGSMAETILRRIDSDPDSVDQAYWQSRRFEPFVIACCELRDGKSGEGRVERIGDPYRSVLLAWDDDVKLQRALESVCDYHCQNMDDTGGDWDPEFKHAPFDLLPCEVMLVKRIREHLGLSMPAVEHPLLTTLNVESVVVASYDEHELLEELSSAFSRCYA